MNKAELIPQVAAQAGVETKTVNSVLTALEDVVAATVRKGEAVQLTGFFKVERVDRKARKGRNPATGEQIRVKASKGVRVSPGASLKKVVSGAEPAAKLARVPAAAPARKATAASARKATPAAKAGRPAATPAKATRRPATKTAAKATTTRAAAASKTAKTTRARAAKA